MKPAAPQLHVHIDRLVLRGLPASAAPALQQALHQALQQASRSSADPHALASVPTASRLRLSLASADPQLIAEALAAQLLHAQRTKPETQR